MGGYSKQFYAHVHKKAQSSAREVVPEVLRLVPAESVIDVGCGTGDWLAVFSQHNVGDYLGVDGSWALEYLQIPKEHFRCHDLTKPLSLGRRYDLVVSLEVAEHLEPECADTFIASLAGLGDVVLFSAAIPQAGGTGHVNEQWPEYWAERFAKHGFQAIDCLRKRFWRNPNVEWFYSQNMILYAHPDSRNRYPFLKEIWSDEPEAPFPMVHPKQFFFMNKRNVSPGDLWQGFVRLILRAIQKRISFVKNKFRNDI